ncbi:cupin domain-containing protein [Methylosinus sp. LW4]|uniref:cupin domain-containing protein n=1 Tax=Methylosinus sp. LW4 TaxID=136993 RepID=UPI00037614B2|nr:cupin domain-containing protein [Methylosinus sp. LW4]
MSDRCYADLLAGGWRALAFSPFRDGVDICWLERGETPNDPSLAVLRYAPGASVPRHRHSGLETIVVLDGAQSDETGELRAGAVALNIPGSAHSVWSKDGCVVLIQWTKPVEILDSEQ